MRDMCITKDAHIAQYNFLLVSNAINQSTVRRHTGLLFNSTQTSSPLLGHVTSGPVTRTTIASDPVCSGDQAYAWGQSRRELRMFWVCQAV